MLHGQNIIVLDLETRWSASDCRHCGGVIGDHEPTTKCCESGGLSRFDALGWRDYVALGLSVGAYYDYQLRRVRWFDEQSLYSTMADLVARQPLMVSFNGRARDFDLMSQLCQAHHKLSAADSLLIAWERLAVGSYDILHEVWQADSDPDNKYVSGLNSLDALLAANNLGQKSGHGAQAPRDWQAGRYAQVLNYCQDDVLLTKTLFERLLTTHGIIQRRDGALPIADPHLWLDAHEPSRKQGEEG